jgi:excisionase family DNA binding protein
MPLEAPPVPARQRPEELLRQLMPTRVVAQLLGVSGATVERAIRSGQLPVLQFRRKRYVNIDDLVSFMREPTKETGKESMDAAIASIVASVQR